MRIKSNLDEILYDRIIESLISGSYSMGENLTLDELSKKFEVSRTPVVQAVKLLVNDGILCSMSNGRLYVPEYDRQSVLEMCQVRELIEVYALRVFMSGEGASPKQILPRLESYAEQFKLLSNESQYAEFATADRKFHGTIVEASGNHILLETYNRVQGRFLVANYLIRPLQMRNLDGTALDHDRIVSAIKDNDIELAGACLREHIAGVLKALSEE